MNLHEAKHLAQSLMLQYGLSGWSFRFDHARRRFGCCRPTKREITLSGPLTRLNGIDEVRDTILHEIAHALAPDDGHGAKWKAACKRVGARPVRCYTNDDVVSPPRAAARFSIGCTACDWWMDRRRVTRRVLICKRCRSPVIYREQSTGKQFVIEAVGRARRLRWITQAESAGVEQYRQAGDEGDQRRH